MRSGKTLVAPDMRPRIIFVSKFGGVMIALYALIALNPVNDHVIVPFTEGIAAASAWVLRIIDSSVEAAGTIIRSPRFALDVRNGCNGIEAVILLTAAIFAFPATLRSRLIGLVVASVLIEVVNVIRLGSLFYLGEHHRPLFDLFHVAVWQSLVILVAIAMFILWSWKFAERPLAPAR